MTQRSDALNDSSSRICEDPNNGRIVIRDYSDARIRFQAKKSEYMIPRVDRVNINASIQ